MFSSFFLCGSSSLPLTHSTLQCGSDWSLSGPWLRWSLFLKKALTFCLFSSFPLASLPSVLGFSGHRWYTWGLDRIRSPGLSEGLHVIENFSEVSVKTFSKERNWEDSFLSLHFFLDSLISFTSYPSCLGVLLLSFLILPFSLFNFTFWCWYKIILQVMRLLLVQKYNRRTNNISTYLIKMVSMDGFWCWGI